MVTRNIGRGYEEADEVFFQELIGEGVKAYPNNLEKQAEFIQFYANEKKGRHHQVFIHDCFEGEEGHAFFGHNGEFIKISFLKHIFYIWKVYLIE